MMKQLSMTGETTSQVVETEAQKASSTAEEQQEESAMRAISQDGEEFNGGSMSMSFFNQFLLPNSALN